MEHIFDFILSIASVEDIKMRVGEWSLGCGGRGEVIEMYIG